MKPYLVGLLDREARIHGLHFINMEKYELPETVQHVLARPACLILAHSIEQADELQGRLHMANEDTRLPLLRLWAGGVVMAGPGLPHKQCVALRLSLNRAWETRQGRRLDLPDIDPALGLKHNTTLMKLKLIRSAAAMTGGNMTEMAKLLKVNRCNMYRTLAELAKPHNRTGEELLQSWREEALYADMDIDS